MTIFSTMPTATPPCGPHRSGAEQAAPTAATVRLRWSGRSYRAGLHATFSCVAPLPSWAGDPLPVDGVLDEVAAALDRRGVAVLEAEPGAGKTTRLPLALHLAALTAQDQRRIVVLQPRRIAARAAARRLASQLGEPVGRTVGLTTRDEHRTSAATRIEVVTEGVVLRRLQRDPSVRGRRPARLRRVPRTVARGRPRAGVRVESRAALREDLRLLVMSATIEGARVARLLGDAPLIRTEGRSPSRHRSSIVPVHRTAGPACGGVLCRRRPARRR
jgi:ATP-dependent helicase HrpB